MILPLVVLRRLDCVLEPTKADVLARAAKLKGRVENVAPILESISGIREVYNTSPLDFRRLLDDPANVAGITSGRDSCLSTDRDSAATGDRGTVYLSPVAERRR